VPEAVEERYFSVAGGEWPVAGGGHPAPGNRPPATVGSFARSSVQSFIEQTMHRIDRFRDDVEWRLFSHPPGPEELAELGAWVDPAVKDDDYDGFVAEALVVGMNMEMNMGMNVGLNVVATATPINVQRLEKGRTGFLVPRNDPNEMTHAILAALFKPEVARARSDAARQTVGKFRAGGRIRALTRIYESIVP
jgi:glycosyltransferase involved in cell wall biosynthesis